MKNPFRGLFTRTNSAAALVPRNNMEGNRLYPESSMNIESVWTGGTRYCDPLIRDHVINKTSANHRERVASEDPLGILVTRVHALLGWSRAPKFYQSDEQGAPEIMQEVRALYSMLKLGDVCEEVSFETLKHGWAGSYVWIDMDENGLPTMMSEIYSATQIEPADIIRDSLNRPQTWLVRGKYPPVPAGYTKGNLKIIRRQFYPGQDGWIVHTRGDYNKTLGYGYSRLVDLWDPITKLRVTSHSDSKRNEIFPLVVYPSSWEPEQVDALFMSLAHVDENAGLAVMSGVDHEGNPVEGLPTIAWRSPAEDAPNVSGEGGPRGLPGEFVRFCALSGITIKELAGDPGGAQEAGATDFAQALEKNIQEWNYSSRPFLEKLLRQLEKWGIITLPPTFVIKGHWEWERDEMMMQQQQMMDEQLENDTRDSESKERQSKQSRSNSETYLAAWAFHQVMRVNVPPGVMTPTTSSWVQSYGYDDSAFYLQFHRKGEPDHRIFRYPYVDDPEAMATEMETSGSPGGFVHRHPDLGVPRNTPYEIIGSLPQSMAWWGGSQAQTEYTGADQGAEKLSQFGTRVPARSPNLEGYPQQTSVQGEQVTGPMRGPGQFDLAGVQAALRGMPRAMPAQQQPMQTAPQSSALPIGQATMPGLQPLATPQQTFAPQQAAMVRGVGRPAGQNLTRPKGHSGKSRQGRPTDAAKGAQYSPFTNPWTYNAAPIEVARVNASILDLDVNDWQELSREHNGGEGFSNATIEKIRRIVTKARILVSRSNYRSRGNAMSFKDHPYRYIENGQLVEEYPCAADWRQNVVSKTGQLKINYDDPATHGDIVVGTVTYGWDEVNNTPSDILEYDRDAVMRALEEHGQQESEVYTRLAAGLDPDISTEYQCYIETRNGRRWQRGFSPSKSTGRFDSCIVDVGNCPSGECDFTPEVTEE